MPILYEKPKEIFWHPHPRYNCSFDNSYLTVQRVKWYRKRRKEIETPEQISDHGCDSNKENRKTNKRS